MTRLGGKIIKDEARSPSHHALSIWAAQAERDYPEFFEEADIVFALERAEKEGVPINALKVNIGWDLRDRKRAMERKSRDRKKPSTDESRRKAEKALKKIEAVIMEIESLRSRYEDGMLEAVGIMDDFPSEYLGEHDKTIIRDFTDRIPVETYGKSLNPPLSSQHTRIMINAIHPIEQAVQPSLAALNRVRDALIATAEPGEERTLAIMRRDSGDIERWPKKRRGKKTDFFINGLIVKYAEFFRWSTGDPKDGIARIIVSYLAKPLRPNALKWVKPDAREGENEADVTKKYKSTREHAEETPAGKFDSEMWRVVNNKYFSSP